MHKKEQILFIVLGGFFICNAIVAEIIGGKLFSVELTLGFEQADIWLFGEKRSFIMTAGVLLWPFVFIMTDIINEYFGMRGVKILSWLAAALIAYAFLMILLAMNTEPASFWQFYTLPDGGKMDLEVAFDQIFGQGLWIIIGSLIAFLTAQFLDAVIFRYLKRRTGEKALWLRATGSTLVSQLLDSFVVLFIAFYIGADWTLETVLAIGIVNYIYKFSVAVCLTPFLYLVHAAVDRFLGNDLSREMMEKAGRKSG